MNAKRIRLTQQRGRNRIYQSCLYGLATAGLIWAASPNLAAADGTTNAHASKAIVAQPAAKPDQKAAKPTKKVSGVELYAIHCNRCHPERYPVEFNEAQWKTLMLHMRVRANLPADQAQAVLKYLQDEAGY